MKPLCIPQESIHQHAVWLGKTGAGKSSALRHVEGRAAILTCLLDVNGVPMSREEIDACTGYKRSARDTYIQRLRARELVVVNGSTIEASPTLF